MIAIEKVLEFLYKEYLLHVDMIECIKNNEYKIIEYIEGGVLISDKEEALIMLTAFNMETAKALIDKIPKGVEMLVIHQYFYCNYLKERFNVYDEMSCYQSVYTKNKPFNIEESSINVKILNEEYVESIFNNYSSKNTVDIKYIKERINTNTMLGAFINEKLVGFIGTHEEGSMGILEVLPQYRKNGIGALLQKHATNLALQQSRIPYGQVKVNNEKSIKLQKKLGFELSSEIVYWLMIK